MRNEKMCIVTRALSLRESTSWSSKPLDKICVYLIVWRGIGLTCSASEESFLAGLLVEVQAARKLVVMHSFIMAA